MEDALRVPLYYLFKQVLSCLNPCSNGRCSASSQRSAFYVRVVAVLILVLMEDALREFRGFFDNRPLDVLILVLMEDALRARYVCSALASNLVLILVLMEDALRAH